ncbi:hypothetical protein DM01DRAFT_1336573 [Hesseltinella vesiculosa]|uniref:Uncharacterized protein n=1 Tax=Hesseltinella vesiculosa TaxID=101127 RepID=A0A1X2GFW1_9FUNG|nr:hypothetical protein DM01DRAFT_1336573 [Hesseltinella vesiculosa]
MLRSPRFFDMLHMIMLLLWTHVGAQSSGDGFDSNQGSPSDSQNNTSWIMRDHHYVIIIVIGLVVAGLVLFYIIRSAKGMRRRMKQDNQRQMHMLNQIPSTAPNHQYQHLQDPPMHQGYAPQGQQEAHQYRY